MKTSKFTKIAILFVLLIPTYFVVRIIQTSKQSSSFTPVVTTMPSKDCGFGEEECCFPVYPDTRTDYSSPVWTDPDGQIVGYSLEWNSTIYSNIQCLINR